MSAPSHARPIVLFDGVCNLCNASVQFLLERDRNGVLRFGSLQSDAGAEVLERCGMDPDHRASIVLVEGDRCYTRSSAALRIAKHLGGFYAALYAFVVVPRPIRDRIYEFVANNRYDWFGQRDSCYRPPADVQDRFLEDPAGQPE
jgi:predicted DCC family thiol-disulfide oxidoreductase YuxK